MPVAYGELSVDEVTLDTRAIAKLFTGYVAQGSKKNFLSAQTPNTHVLPGTTKENLSTIEKCLTAGMKLFDAVVWFASDKKKELVEDQEIKKDKIPTTREVAQALFYCYFFLLTQARYPGVGTGPQLDNVPKFLSSVLGLGQGQKHYAEILCGFEIAHFDGRWIEHYPHHMLGLEARNRFGLGVAGYRMAGPFKYYVPSQTLSAAQAAAVEFAREMACSNPSWNVHPLTRDEQLLAKCGNLNQNLGNLILEVYTGEEIEAMRKAQILYAAPVHAPSHLNYKTWHKGLYDFNTRPIFPQSNPGAA